MLWWTLRQLKSDDWRAAERAALELGAAKEAQAVEPLLNVLGSGLDRVRQAAAWALAEIGDRRAVEPLIQAFRNNPVERYAQALARFGDPRAVEPLLAALIHKDEDVRELAAGTIGKIDPEWPRSPAAREAAPRFVEALGDRDPEVKRWALEVLERIGDRRAGEALLRVIERQTEAAGWAVRELNRIEPGWTRKPEAKAAVAPLVAVLRTQGFERELAAATLAEIGDPDAVGPLLEALRDRDRDLRNAAARALGRIGDARAIAPVAAAPLSGMLDPWVAQQTLNAIDPKWAGATEARTALLACLYKLADDDWSVRQYAESTLAVIDPNWAKSPEAQDAVPVFAARLEHTNAQVREAAQRALARIEAARQ